MSFKKVLNKTIGKPKKKGVYILDGKTEYSYSSKFRVLLKKGTIKAQVNIGKGWITINPVKTINQLLIFIKLHHRGKKK